MSTETISIVLGALVGLGGITAGVVTSRSQLSHAERLAREARVQERRGEAYIELLTGVRAATARMADAVQMTRDSEREGQREPDTSVDVNHLEALLAAYGSASVRACFRDWYDAGSAFQEVANDARTDHPEGRGLPTERMRDAMASVLAAEEALQAVARRDLEESG